MIETGFITIVSSKDLIDSYMQYVNDRNDVQILKDAIDAKAEYILTKNTKDFKTN